jgi:hypothetical protein
LVGVAGGFELVLRDVNRPGFVSGSRTRTGVFNWGRGGL